MSKITDTLAKYDTVITDQWEHSVIEKVESIGIPGKVKYLPYQAVIRDDNSSTKPRVTFDASSKTISPSLNDTLYKEPYLTPLLFDVLLCFWFNPIGVIADIEKASYLQISVADCHCDFLRFLWFGDIFKDILEVSKYRLNWDFLMQVSMLVNRKPITLICRVILIKWKISFDQLLKSRPTIKLTF